MWSGWAGQFGGSNSVVVVVVGHVRGKGVDSVWLGMQCNQAGAECARQLGACEGFSDISLADIRDVDNGGVFVLFEQCDGVYM